MSPSKPSPLPAEFAEPLRRIDSPFARHVLWYVEAASTNDVASGLAERGAEDGTVILANSQSAGRGRHGRTWVSPPGAGLYVSVVLRPSPVEIPLLTIAAGVAVADGIQAATGLSPRLKWPNDVYVGDRKVAGVLAEAATGGSTVEYVVLGFGVNVLPAAYPPDVAARATSLEDELGRQVDRGLLLASCLAALTARYADLQGGSAATVLQRWRDRAATTLGRRVQWESAGQMLEGITQDIDGSGALIVRTEAGPTRVISGEVRWM